jgi:hypothetical protein
VFTPAVENCPPRYMALLKLREVISLHHDLPTLVHEHDGFIQSPTSSTLYLYYLIPCNSVTHSPRA